MPTARRIAFVCPRFAQGRTLGGAETLLKQLARRLAATGRDVTFLATCATDHFTWKNEIPAGVREIEGLPVHFFPVDDRDTALFLKVQERISRGKRVSLDEERAWLRNGVNSASLCQYLKEHVDDYDAVVSGPYLFGLVEAVSHACPDKSVLVPCLHDEPFSRLSLIHDMFHRVSKVMFNSLPERTLALDLYNIPETRTSVVGMGLEPFPVDARALADRRQIHSPYVIYAGRREPLKGTPLLLDYMTTFRSRTGIDVKLVLTGAGELSAPRELVPHIIDLGFVSEREKQQAMAGAIAFCHPSQNESFGIVIMEAWLAGVPVLVKAQSEVLRYHCEKSNGGLWFRDYPEFEELLGLLLNRSDMRSALATAGKSYVTEEYSWDAVEKRLTSALDS